MKQKTRLWLLLTLIVIAWCGFIGVAAYGEWLEYEKALTSLQSLRLFEHDTSSTPPIGLDVLDLKHFVRMRVQHSYIVMWLFGAIALVPSVAILLMGWVLARAVATAEQRGPS